VIAAFAFSALLAVAADFKVPPTPDHYVTDNVGALSGAVRASVENQLQAYQAATGHQVIVWIGGTTGDVPLETWTGETADQWKIGRKGHDDGAVLFLFMQDRKIRIEVGYGLESELTDADSFRIIRTVIAPRMRAGDVDSAVASGVAAMLVTISPSYKGVTPPPQAATDESSSVEFWVVIVFIVISIMFPLLLSLMMRRAGYVVTGGGPRGVFFGGFGGGGFGGGFGGGGFSGGGGSFGGGGASGGW
jgi:uncharacterized protein